jgi:hypothetical protein
MRKAACACSGFVPCRGEKARWWRTRPRRRRHPCDHWGRVRRRDRHRAYAASAASGHRRGRRRLRAGEFWIGDPPLPGAAPPAVRFRQRRSGGRRAGRRRCRSTSAEVPVEGGPGPGCNLVGHGVVGEQPGDLSEQRPDLRSNGAGCRPSAQGHDAPLRAPHLRLYRSSPGWSKSESPQSSRVRPRSIAHRIAAPWTASLGRSDRRSGIEAPNL